MVRCHRLGNLKTNNLSLVEYQSGSLMALRKPSQIRKLLLSACYREHAIEAAQSIPRCLF